MQSPFLFRRANVFEYTWRKGKTNLRFAANVASGVVYQAYQFYSSQDVTVKKRMLQEGMVLKVTVLC